MSAGRYKSFVLFAFLAIALLGANACVPTISQRGYLHDPERAQTITPGKDTKVTINEKWGAPSTISTFDDNTWYYISSKQREEAFFLPETIEQKITAVEFDTEGKVKGVTEHDISEAQKVNIVGRVTPTRGRELSFLEQIFGNIGRVGTSSTETAQKPGR